MPASIIGSIVKEEAKRRGITLVQLSNLVGVSYAHLRAVLKGVYVSRPVIRKISRILDLPDLPERYEQFLHEKRMRAKEVEDKAGVSTSEEEGGR